MLAVRHGISAKGSPQHASAPRLGVASQHGINSIWDLSVCMPDYV